jgi:serine/threonine protein kinase
MTIQCPTCFTDNNDTEPYCLVCGVPLASLQPKTSKVSTIKPSTIQSPTAKTFPVSKVKCSKCSTDNLATEEFCIKCHTALKTIRIGTIELPHDTILEHRDPLTNQVVNRYRILTYIGRGGFAITYREVDENTNETVVIKERFPEKKGGRKKENVDWGFGTPREDVEKIIDEFKREAEILSKCSHPSIVKYHGYFENNNTCYIVMAFIQGKSMQNMISEQGRLEEKTVVKYITQISEALKEIHALGILHRDIKPDNIMIDTNQNRAILIDFGTARDFEQNRTGELTQVLTPGYAPVEQYTRKQKRTFSADLYSLCASIYHAIVGETPVPSPDRQLSKTGDPLLSPSQMGIPISSNLEEIILIGMKMSLKDRFFNAEHLLSYLNGTPMDRDFVEAEYLLKSRQVDEADRLYLAFLNKNLPANANNLQYQHEARIKRSQILLQRGQINEAQKLAEQAIQHKPSDRKVNGIIGYIYCKQNNWQKAQQALAIATNNQINEVVLCLYQVLALGKIGDWQTAISLVEKILKLPEVQQNESYLAVAFGLQSWVALNKQEWKLAIQSSMRSLTYSESQSSTSLNSADTKSLQTWVLACRAMAIERYPILGVNSRDMQVCLDKFENLIGTNALRESLEGWQLIQSDRKDQALQVLENISNHQASVPYWINFNLAILYESKADIQKAIQSYEKCLDIRCDDPDLLFRIGSLLAKQKRYLEALSKLEKANKVKPNFAKALHQQGSVLLKIIKNGIIIQGRDISKLNQDLVESYIKAEEIYRIEGFDITADKLKQTLYPLIK